MKQKSNSPTRLPPTVPQDAIVNGRLADSDSENQDTEQNRKTFQLLSQAPIFVLQDHGHFEEDECPRGNFWLSWLANALWIIPVLFLARWCLIAFFDGHAPDFDFVMHCIHP